MHFSNTCNSALVSLKNKYIMFVKLYLTLGMFFFLDCIRKNRLNNIWSENADDNVSNQILFTTFKIKLHEFIWK